ncbi:MAG: CDGSH iron-sulfur domain-containing protein [Acidimicrobiales bacterium]
MAENDVAEVTAQIKARPNGPYVVTGSVPLVVKTPVETAASEPIGWITGPTLDRGAAYALCRCGGSANKPYCDGTHANNGFDGTETADRGAYRDRATVMRGEGIAVRDDRSICEHAGFCGTQLTNVWKMVGAAGDTAVRSQMIAMVERCPSGALTWALDEAGPDVEPDLPTQIAVVPDGPLWVSGAVAVECSDGGAIESRNRMTLCRCGASKNKPLCDGTHKDVGFRHTPGA